MSHIRARIMPKKIKSHLVIGNKFLGSLLYFKDKSGRGSLKLSFKNKIGGFVKGTNIPTTLPVLTKLNSPLSLEISYKFPDSLLEVKKIVGKKIEREFYHVPLPISAILFMIRIKDWQLLDKDNVSTNQLVLIPPDSTNSVAIIFSFLRSNGLPFMPTGYQCPGMRTVAISENSLSTFCIGIAPDPNNQDSNNFLIQIPSYYENT